MFISVVFCCRLPTYYNYNNMAKWRITRQMYGNDEFVMKEGDEISIGRGADNTITLSSLVISRQHCVLKAFKDKVTIEDLKVWFE